MTVLDGSLYVFKRIPVKNSTVKGLSRFFAQKLPENTQEAIA